MNKEINKIVPELRFPEFLNDGDWEEEELGKISEIVRGGSPRPIQEYLTTKKDGLNWLKIADVPSDSKYITETKEKVIKAAYNSTREVNSGDLILSNSMSFGRPYILKIKTCIHDGWIAIRKITNKTFEDYLYYFISSESSQSYFQTNAAGAAVKNLNAEIIKLLPIYLPKNKKEQNIIASCLSSLDELLTAHSQKLDALKDHKKGMMQNLFPQEGKTLPKLRFKEFEKDGEWEEKILSKITDAIFDGTHQTPIYTEKGIPFFSVENIVSGNKNKFISREDYEIATNKNKPEKGDILITRIGNIGFSAIIDWDYEFSIYVTLACIKKSKNFNSYYLHSYFQSNTYQKEILSKSLLNATPCKINMNELRGTKILIPKNPEEQHRIASCLSSLDELITAQSDKIEQMKLHKKGLMQGLFPKIND